MVQRVSCQTSYKQELLSCSPNTKVFKNNYNLATKASFHQTQSHTQYCSQLQNEYKILSRMYHPNIIRVQGQLCQNQPFDDQRSCFFTLELAECNLLQKITLQYPALMPIKNIKQIFLQIAKAIYFLHSNNISHNDIKLDNILMLGNKPKLADFGYSRLKPDKNRQDQIFNWKMRTWHNLSPEFIQNIQKYDENQQKYKNMEILNEKFNDIWQLGLCLFQMVLLCSPFQNEYPSAWDPLFKQFYKNQYKEYWKQQIICDKIKFYDQDQDLQIQLFQDLINKMLNIDPYKRIDILQVINHDWFQQK